MSSVLGPRAPRPPRCVDVKILRLPMPSGLHQTTVHTLPYRDVRAHHSFSKRACMNSGLHAATCLAGTFRSSESNCTLRICDQESGGWRVNAVGVALTVSVAMVAIQASHGSERNSLQKHVERTGEPRSLLKFASKQRLGYIDQFFQVWLSKRSGIPFQVLFPASANTPYHAKWRLRS